MSNCDIVDYVHVPHIYSADLEYIVHLLNLAKKQETSSNDNVPYLSKQDGYQLLVLRIDIRDCEPCWRSVHEHVPHEHH